MKHLGKALVFVQFSGIGCTCYAGMLFFPPARPVASIISLAGVVLGLYTLGYNRIGNFNIVPRPRPNALLITGGPYQLIRHPMYLSVILFLAGITIQAGGHFLALFGTVLATTAMIWKSIIEERLLIKQYPDYNSYRARTKRIVPFIF